MSTYLKFAAIPLGIVVLFFFIPKLLAFLVNSHTDVGIVAIVAVVCGIFSVIATKLYNVFIKEQTENER